MFDSSNTPVAVRAEDQLLIKAINDVRRRYPFSDAVAKQLLDAFTKPPPALRPWVFELCDPTLRADPFMTNDDLAAFARAVLTGGQDCNARWADLTRTVRRLARRIKHFAQDKTHVWMGAGPPRNVDRALVLYVIRRIEEVIGVEFRFSQRRRPAEAAFDEDESSPPLNSSGGPMLRLAEAALLRLFHIDNRTAGYLGLVSPARHYKRDEIARTAKLARRASRTSPASPAKWQSDLILAYPSDVRVELAGKARQENKDRGPRSSGIGLVPPSSWVMSSWVDLRETLEAAAAGERQTPSGLDVLQANLKGGAQPDLIELSKRRSPRADVRQEQQSASTSPRSRSMILVAERTLPEPPTSPPPSTGGTA